MKWDVELFPRHPLKDAPLFGPCPPSIPKPFWRSVGWARLYVYVPFVAIVVDLLLFRSAWALFVLPLVLMGALAFLTLPYIVFRRFTARLAAHDYLLCLSCGYWLKDLPEDHNCPECGAPYRTEALRRAWRYWVEKRKLPRDVTEQG